MKKLLLTVLTFCLMLSLFSCAFKDVIEFQGDDGKTYYYEYSEGIKTITNYHPYKFWALPDYQEMVQYGDGAGLENGGVVYFIYVVDTSIDSDDPKAYYSAELDGESRELLCESGEFFSDEAGKREVIDRLLNEIDIAYFK